MDARLEFVMLALGEGANIRQLCRRFAIARRAATNGWRAGERPG